MDRLSELGTARGFALRALERAKRDLVLAEIEFEARDREYQEYVDEREGLPRVVPDNA